MSKAPKHPSQSDGPKRQNDEGDAPRSRVSTRKPRSLPKRRAETVLDSVSTDIPSGVMEGPEGSSSSSPPPAQDDALARARSLIAEGNQNEGTSKAHPTRSGPTPSHRCRRSHSRMDLLRRNLIKALQATYASPAKVWKCEPTNSKNQLRITL